MCAPSSSCLPGPAPPVPGRPWSVHSPDLYVCKSPHRRFCASASPPVRGARRPSQPCWARVRACRGSTPPGFPQAFSRDTRGPRSAPGRAGVRRPGLLGAEGRAAAGAVGAAVPPRAFSFAFDNFLPEEILSYSVKALNPFCLPGALGLFTWKKKKESKPNPW